MALLLSGIKFPLKNLFYELKYQSRMKKLIYLPTSSLTAFSNERLCVKIKLLTCTDCMLIFPLDCEPPEDRGLILLYLYYGRD